MLKALVFDFDGIIIDTETEWFYIYKEWLKDTYQYELDIHDYLVSVGSDCKALFAFLEKELGTLPDWDHFMKWATEEFVRRSENLPPMEGVAELLAKAKAKGLKIALATSSRMEKPKAQLERLGFLPYFDALSTKEMSQHVKPAPDIFLKAAELLEAEPEECLAVEDSGNGLLAANRAGMPCLVVPNGITKYCHFENYYKLLDSLSQVDLDQVEKEFACEDTGNSH